jgi:hypothetical protein
MLQPDFLIFAFQPLRKTFKQRFKIMSNFFVAKSDESAESDYLRKSDDKLNKTADK